MIKLAHANQKYTINEDFFKVWSSNMAYILGFTCADGNVYGKTLSWDLANKFISNKKLLESINEVMFSNYPIEERRNSFRLRISNKVILDDIKNLGIVPNKNKVLKLPKVPDVYFRDFVRGFLDGDGWIAISQKKMYVEFSVGFSNGSYEFMSDLICELRKILNFKNINLRTRRKITLRNVESIYYQIDFYSNNGYKLLKYLFDDISENDLYLKRKYRKQLIARRIHKIKLKYL